MPLRRSITLGLSGSLNYVLEGLLGAADDHHGLAALSLVTGLDNPTFVPLASISFCRTAEALKVYRQQRK